LEKFEIIATTIFGLEEVLASELREIGATDVELLNRAVRFKGDKAMLYKSNLLLRTAVKILKPIHSFFAANEQQLYDNIKKIDWSEYFTYNNTFAIDGATHSDIFNHSKYVALKSKDAIADQFREKFSIRPSVDPANPDMCGSGTFPIEAALLANNIPSGRNRNFGFEKWKDFDEEIWNNVKEEANSKIIHSDVKIFARDSDNYIVDIAIENAKRAGVQDLIEFESVDFFQTSHTAGKGIVVINPPYGERLQVDDIVNFYEDMGSRLKHFYQGCDAWIISANYEALKFFGLRTSRKIKLFNGPMECRLQKYELYQGSKKASKSGTQPSE